MKSEKRFVVRDRLYHLRRFLGSRLRAKGMGKGLHGCILVLLALAAPVAADPECTRAGRTLATSLRACPNAGRPGDCCQNAMANYGGAVRFINGGCHDDGNRLNNCASACLVDADDIACVTACVRQYDAD